MAKKGTFIVLSPDGFPIEMDKEYKNKKEVKEAIDKFVDRYRRQGYYSKATTVRVQIPVHEIEAECRIVEL
jgi:hypothetical protein